MKKFMLILFSISIFTGIYAQAPEKEKPVFPKFNIGLGLGMDYGGIGGRIAAVASEIFEFFVAVGYDLVGAGVNAGFDFRLMPHSRVCPIVGAMYGYNAVIKVDGAPEYNKIYYGPSFAAGLEFWSRRRPNFFNIE